MPTLTEVLILHGSLPIEYLDTVMSNDPADEGGARALVESGVITSMQLARARAVQTNLPFVDLLDYPVDRVAVATVSAAVCKRHEVLPIAVSMNRLVLAMVNPGNVVALDDVMQASRMKINPVVVERADLLAAIERYHRADDELSNLTTTLEEEQSPEESSFGVSDSLDDDAPIVRFVNLLVSQAIQDKASDIHIEPAEHSLGVRYRIDGVLHDMQRAPKSIQNGVISRLKIMADIDIAERRKPQDGRMSVSHGGRHIDLRVATLPTVWGEKVVMRILDNSSTSMSLQDLNLLPDNFEAYRRSYSKPYGMILVTGPTGSGKSTTLYTTLHTVARPEINVITVEDPVEYRMAGINQVQVNPKAGLTFASALRSILRSDPDVVLIGEIRDHETAQIAIEASLTGHLVLSTLHTNDAPSAVTRLTEMGIEPFLVGSALDCVVAQRLARRLCDRCKAPDERDSGELMHLRFSTPQDTEPPVLFKPVGCPSCSNTGYRGRIAVHEVMTVSEEIERLTVAHASSADIAQAARDQGMITLREDGWTKVRMGLTSIEEVLRVVA
ncbi:MULTISPECIES: GspE/PulE family protein [unclassified Cryobacterium]|uniref:GspE/PulE family protein n=1 Tax=unclassified Cryobacterium TaxID=2649013 RepID=UPI00106D6496|nr:MULTISPECIES: ATPase, T2SS/T4P/T4SS family [unclassified Cryobacterium]TFC56938.1 type II secretion system protein GspE [Cryobacterium sp. TMB3-1-2]TFC67895.1 type II secretion system protein GspE [Cryobacterium sp. TMB3-15]TFC76814.1 type II secretion system protein GspE [Cryobacterium sp. TMB3-10]TFD42231.1 type II secretion system protein GspE [Cryobacterium sp. TMB3-12]